MSVTRPRPLAIALAKEVVAAETRGSESRGVEVIILTKLHATLGKLIGTHGFDVVLARALTLAQREEPSLRNAVVEPGGTLKGMASAPADCECGLIAVLSQLVELLMRFVGEDLAGRVVRDTWPNVEFVSRSETT
jgi:hypothetical protein